MAASNDGRGRAAAGGDASRGSAGTEDLIPRADPDWGDDRRLCPVDSCTGVLDAAGHCPECAGTPRVIATAHAPALHRDPETLDPGEDRVLCSDDACIGLVGPDGRCKECGLAGTTVFR